MASRVSPRLPLRRLQARAALGRLHSAGLQQQAMVGMQLKQKSLSGRSQMKASAGALPSHRQALQTRRPQALAARAAAQTMASPGATHL